MQCCEQRDNNIALKHQYALEGSARQTHKDELVPAIIHTYIEPWAPNCVLSEGTPFEKRDIIRSSNLAFGLIMQNTCNGQSVSQHL